ncbi:MAG: glucose-1-phosphate adenylyltransferase subunit GlgD [Clostridia bacterium]|nr:glucose-1-phosphate adenylyltransferase subunit GlgD [Clostridia bacterium]
MTGNAFGLIFTGESNMQLRDLTTSRSIAAVPYGGRYRCIDFVLSCMVNSGITNVGIITQKNYHSLMDHLGAGKEWDLNRKRDGLFILPPYVTKDSTGVYKGTADALRSVMGYVRRSAQKYCVLTGSHTIYNTTFDDMLRFHEQRGADITILYNVERTFSPDDQFDDLRLSLDEDGRVTDMEIDPYRPKTQFQSCDCFILEKSLLEYLVEEAAAHAQHDFIRDILIRKTNSLKIYGYRYDGFVARLNSMGMYFNQSMALLNSDVRNDVFNPEHPIYTKVKDEVPARYGSTSSVSNSFIADGCIIDGAVENSILFRGVRIGRGAVVRNSIVMQAADIGEDTHLDYVIMDKGVTVKRGRTLSGHNSFPVVLRKGMVV